MASTIQWVWSVMSTFSRWWIMMAITTRTTSFSWITHLNLMVGQFFIWRINLILLPVMMVVMMSRMIGLIQWQFSWSFWTFFRSTKAQILGISFSLTGRKSRWFRTLSWIICSFGTDSIIGIGFFVFSRQWWRRMIGRRWWKWNYGGCIKWCSWNVYSRRSFLVM